MSERYSRGRFSRRAKSLGLVDYKDTALLMSFVGERGKILSRTVSGLSAKDQRQITRAIKRARHLSLLPFVSASSMRGESRRESEGGAELEMMMDEES